MILTASHRDGKIEFRHSRPCNRLRDACSNFLRCSENYFSITSRITLRCLNVYDLCGHGHDAYASLAYKEVLIAVKDR